MFTMNSPVQTIQYQKRSDFNHPLTFPHLPVQTNSSIFFDISPAAYLIFYVNMIRKKKAEKKTFNKITAETFLPLIASTDKHK